MKDVELRELFRELLNYAGKRTSDVEEKIDALDHRIDAAVATLIGGDPKEVIARMERMERKIESMVEARSPARNGIAGGIAESRHKDIIQRLDRIILPQPLELPSPRVPMFVGAVGALIFGALIFAAGMWTVWFLGAAR